MIFHCYRAIRHFLYSQQLFTALRITIGIVLPALVLILAFDWVEPGLASAIGALCVGLMDQPGEWRSQHRDMLTTALLISLSALLTALAQAHPVLLWSTILLMSFCGAFAAAFGNRASIIGINIILVMVIGLSQRGPLASHAPYLAGLALGAFWYVYYSLAVCWLCKYQIASRALAQCFFATAIYIDKHSEFYNPEIPIEPGYQRLFAQQIAVQESQQKAYELIVNLLRYNHQTRLGKKHHMTLFILLIDVIELHDAILAAYTDLALLRTQLGNRDSLQCRHELLSKISHELTHLAVAVVSRRDPPAQENLKAAWQALVSDLDQTRLTSLPRMQPSSYAKLVASSAYIGRIVAVMDRMHQHFTSSRPSTKVSIAAEIAHGYPTPALITVPTPLYYHAAWRYALRFTLAMLAALTASELLWGNHANWILLTVLVALRPSFGQSHQRSQQRLFGTLAGCCAAALLLVTSPNSYLLFTVMVFSLLLSFSLIQINYLCSVFFISLNVILVYHILAPGEQHLVQERVTDTLVGAAIAAIASYLLPCWECQLIKPTVSAVQQQSHHYLQTMLQQHRDRPAYRIARRDMLAALSALSTSYQRMLLEPASKRLAQPQVNALQLCCHLLIAQITALHYRLANSPSLRRSPIVGSALSQAIEALQGATLAPLSPEQSEQAARIDTHLVTLPSTAAELSRLVQHILRA